MPKREIEREREQERSWRSGDTGEMKGNAGETDGKWSGGGTGGRVEGGWRAEGLHSPASRRGRDKGGFHRRATFPYNLQ